MGGKLGEADSSSVEVILPDGFGSSFTERAIRAKFIRKVYLILLSQLTLTAGIVSVFLFVPAIKTFYCDHTFEDARGEVHCLSASVGGRAMYWVSYILFFITYMALACCESFRRKSPWNLFAMGFFTLAMSVMVS